MLILLSKRIADRLLLPLQLLLSLLGHDVHDRPGRLGRLLQVLGNAGLAYRSLGVDGRLL